MTLPMDPSVEAAREAARAAVSAAPPSSLRRSPFSRPGPRVALVVTLVAAIVLVTVLMPTGAPGTRYTDVREIMAAPASFDGHAVAVVGGVQGGNATSLGISGTIAFNLTDYSDESVWIRVVYTGGMDSNFAPGKKVLAEGTITVVGGVAKLLATKISIGCPTDYRGGPPAQ